MSSPTIYGKPRAFSASAMLDAVGTVIGQIKRRDGLTYNDIGAAFGKSEDVAASYAAGHSDMPLSAFLRGGAALGDEILDAALAFVGRTSAPLNPVPVTPDTNKLAPIARAVAMVAECTAPESCGGTTISRAELLANEVAIRDLMLAATELNQALDSALGVGVR